jgi:phosphoglycolate phosphatase
MQEQRIFSGISHVVWDWNGTLLDDVSASVAAMNRMLARRNMAALHEERYRDIFEFPVRRYYDALGFDFSREDWDALAREYHDEYEDCARTAPLRAGIMDTLQACRAAGLGMSVLSASELSILTRMMAERAMPGFFQSVCGLSNLHAVSKLELGRKLLAETGIPAANVLFVGDTVHDYEVARELNCRCLLLAGGHQSRQRLSACGAMVAEDAAAVLEWRGAV